MLQMSRQRVPGDGPKCMVCGRPAVWSGYCQMEDGRGYCNAQRPTAASERAIVASNQFPEEPMVGIDGQAKAAWNIRYPKFATDAERAAVPEAMRQFRAFIAGYVAGVKA